MSDAGPFGPDDEAPDPFRGIPLIGDLARLVQSQMGGQGPVAWDAARQLALSIAAPDGVESNVDPADRIALEELARIAELHVGTATGLRTATTSGALRVTAVTRAQWAASTLVDYRPLFEDLARALTSGSDEHGSASSDPDDLLGAAGADAAAFLGPLFEMMAPMRAAMMAGSLVGNLALTALGPYRLPVHRPGDELSMPLPTIRAFADAWSLPSDEMQLWVCVREVAHHAVLLVPHVNERLDDLVRRYAGGFTSDPGALERRLGDLDASNLDPTALLGDPGLLLGASESPAQSDLRPHIDALVAVVSGVVDHVLDVVSAQLLGSGALIAEAVRRQQSGSDTADELANHLLGIDLSRATLERGRAFVSGVLERGDDAGLSRLWADPRNLPTPAEVDAPGLWLARIDLP